VTERSIHAYGSDRSQVCELFSPDGVGPHPVVVVVHGGYWRARYDRSLMTDLCVDLAEHDVAAWNIEYRRVGSGGGWPHTFLDAAAATDLLAEIDVPLDLSRVVGVGHSAGGHLAFWIAARPTLPPATPGSQPRVRLSAAVSQAGVLDLRLASELTPSDEPTRALLGAPDRYPEVYDLASPRERVPLGIPQLILHGERDTAAAPEISRSYAEAAQALGDPCELRLLPGTGHFEHIDSGADAWLIAREWLLSYVMAERS
jgi:acetyl esterase/lipase